mmetsp:Transcript_117553/g.332579  ORF Transcript_117553/g.332579 Transcript_117553/m.332579 type:complete len:209 (-) Transcript_117553:9-635(-)
MTIVALGRPMAEAWRHPPEHLDALEAGAARRPWRSSPQLACAPRRRLLTPRMEAALQLRRQCSREVVPERPQRRLPPPKCRPMRGRRGWRPRRRSGRHLADRACAWTLQWPWAGIAQTGRSCFVGAPATIRTSLLSGSRYRCGMSQGIHWSAHCANSGTSAALETSRLAHVTSGLAWRLHAVRRGCSFCRQPKTRRAVVAVHCFWATR